jgi:hypothetical protein
MRLLLRLATLFVLIGTAACTAAPPAPSAAPTQTPSAAATPTPSAAPTPAPAAAFAGFSVGADTGSVPPPFNYTYTLDGTFQTYALSVHYVLTYQFRDQVTPDQVTSQGYTSHDNIDWSGRLTGGALDTWRTLLAQTKLGPIPPLAPGSESFSVTLTPQTGEPQVGVPENRDAWQAAITALDKQARAETGATRSKP